MKYTEILARDLDNKNETIASLYQHCTKEPDLEQLLLDWDTILELRKIKKKFDRRLRNLDNEVYSKMCQLLKEKTCKKE